MTARRPRLLVLNLYYDTVEASGQVLRQLCEDLAETIDVTVVAALPPDVPGAREGRPVPGVEVRWVPATRFSRTSPFGRLANYLSFLVGVLFALARAGRPDVVYCMTDPPVIGLVGLAFARRRGARFLLTAQDVHPDLGIASGRLRSPLVVAALRASQRVLLRRSDHVVAISDAMKQRLLEKGAPAYRMSVIPNWVDLDGIDPQPRDNEWARRHGLDDCFTVMHSGNVGFLQSLDTLLDAAARVPEVQVAIVGQGTRKAELEARAAREGLTNVRFLPHQPRSELRQSLASADAHIVSLVPGVGGLIEPSKLYGVLAAARPVIASVDAGSEPDRVVAQANCGLSVPAGDAEALAAAIREMRGMSQTALRRMGAGGRQLAEERYARPVLTASYRDLVEKLAR